MNVGSFPFGQEDDEETIGQFRDQTGITFPIALHADEHYALLIRSPEESPFPNEVVVGPNGRVIYLAHDHDAARLLQVVNAITQE
jgi:hypothetical protein